MNLSGYKGELVCAGDLPQHLGHEELVHVRQRLPQHGKQDEQEGLPRHRLQRSPPSACDPMRGTPA